LDQNKIKYIEHRLDFEKKMLLELLPEEHKEEFEKKAYISGGCIYSLYHNQEPKDYDFFVTSESLVNKLREHFLQLSSYKSKTKSGGIYKSYPLLVTDNAISIGKYQIITRWIGSPEEVVGQFDFKHNMFYFNNGKIDTLSDFDFLESDTLVFNEGRARDIVHVIMRVGKYLKRNMDISQKEMAKILLQLKNAGFSQHETTLLEANKDKSEYEHFDS
jgi:hypothetical protein